MLLKLRNTHLGIPKYSSFAMLQLLKESRSFCKSRMSDDMAVVIDGMLLEFSPLLRLQVAVERKLITAFTRSGILEGGR